MLKKRNKEGFQIIVIFVGIIAAISGGIIKNLDLMGAGVIIVWIGNMLFCFRDFQKRFFFFLFQNSLQV